MPLKEKNPIFHYHPSSFYSQKAAITLIEKGIDFKDNKIDIRYGGTLTPEYLRMNKMGTVPILEDGAGNFIPDSVAIQEYLEANSDSTHKLYLRKDSEMYKDFMELNQRMDDLNVFLVTFGTFIRPEKAKNAMIPKFFIKKAITTPETSIKDIDKYSAKHPELKDIYERKRKFWSDRYDLIRDDEKYNQELQKLTNILDDSEKRLVMSKRSQNNTEYWLFGEQFTVADINLGCYLSRLKGLGLDKDLFLNEAAHRPELRAYSERISSRASFQRFKPSVFMVFDTILKLIQPYVMGGLVLGGAVCVGYYYLRKG